MDGWWVQNGGVWVDRDPGALGVGVVVIVVALAVVAVAGHARRPAGRDPIRWFTAEQRGLARRRSGGRCEYGGVFGLGRCRQMVGEIDHFVPHASGGATVMRNAVAACARHNQAKGGRRPTSATAAAIAWRRRGYFPAGVRRWPGAVWRPGIKDPAWTSRGMRQR